MTTIAAAGPLSAGLAAAASSPAAGSVVYGHAAVPHKRDRRADPDQKQQKSVDDAREREVVSFMIRRSVLAETPISRGQPWRFGHRCSEQHLVRVRAPGLTHAYLSKISRGEKVPHPRHWPAIRAAVEAHR
jgi:hypothetical protein